jgi:hypothetical protein
MTADRRTELLMTAARALEDGRDPLAEPFLSDHEVTLDECYSLAEQLAVGARVVALGLAKPASEEGRVVLLTMARFA